MVTHKKLSPGYQAVQSGHALVEFIKKHPEISDDWYNISNYLVYLSVNNQEELLNLAEKLSWKDIVFSEFHEPDLDNALTAIAIEPSERARRMVSSIPLLLQEYNQKYRKEIEYEN